MMRTDFKSIRYLSLALILGLGGVLASCGPSNTIASRTAGSSVDGTSPDPAAGDVQPSDGGSPGAGGHASARPNASGHGSSASSSSSPYPQFAPGTSPAPVVASLSKGCVTRGAFQTLTVQTTPKYFLSFDVQYSDQSEGKSHGSGWGVVQVPPSGKYTYSWVIDPTVPDGKAIVFVAISGPNRVTGFRQPTFTVAPTC
jgi:hypothetical protein